MLISDCSSNVCSSDLWAFLTFLALLISAAPARAQEPTDDQLLRHFDAVAFGSEYAGAPIGFVRKWKRPIVIGVQGEPPAYFEDFVRQHAADLAKITGHRLTYGYSPATERERSEEHTSELQSLMRISYAVFCLKKKNNY